MAYTTTIYKLWNLCNLASEGQKYVEDVEKITTA